MTAGWEIKVLPGLSLTHSFPSLKNRKKSCFSLLGLE